MKPKPKPAQQGETWKEYMARITEHYQPEIDKRLKKKKNES